MTQHTPGPWTKQFPFILGPDGKIIASVEKDYFDLIAAAPEMLAVLQELSRECDLDPSILEPEAELLKSIRAAIAKATGGNEP